MTIQEYLSSDDFSLAQIGFHLLRTDSKPLVDKKRLLNHVKQGSTNNQNRFMEIEFEKPGFPAGFYRINNGYRSENDPIRGYSSVYKYLGVL